MREAPGALCTISHCSRMFEGIVSGTFAVAKRRTYGEKASAAGGRWGEPTSRSVLAEKEKKPPWGFCVFLGERGWVPHSTGLLNRAGASDFDGFDDPRVDIQSAQRRLSLTALQLFEKCKGRPSANKSRGETAGPRIFLPNGKAGGKKER